jgi:hypothetical protein
MILYPATCLEVLISAAAVLLSITVWSCVTAVF